jgi:hypothetical protein
MSLAASNILCVVVVGIIYTIILYTGFVRIKDIPIRVAIGLFWALMVFALGHGIGHDFAKVFSKEEPKTAQTTQTTGSNPIRDMVVIGMVRSYDAGCLDGLQMIIRKVPQAKLRGDPEDYCGPRSELVRKQLTEDRGSK